MSCELTILERGTVIYHTEMSDLAFEQAIGCGWAEGAIVSLDLPPYLFLVEEMRKPRVDALGLCQLEAGHVTLERFVPQ